MRAPVVTLRIAPGGGWFINKFDKILWAAQHKSFACRRRRLSLSWGRIFHSAFVNKLALARGEWINKQTEKEKLMP